MNDRVGSKQTVSTPLTTLAEGVGRATSIFLAGIRSGEIQADIATTRLSALLKNAYAAAPGAAKGARRKDLERFLAAIDAYAEQVASGMRQAGLGGLTRDASFEVGGLGRSAYTELQSTKHLKAAERAAQKRAHALSPDIPSNASPLSIPATGPLQRAFEAMALNAESREVPVYTVWQGVPAVVAPGADIHEMIDAYSARIEKEPPVGLQDAFAAHLRASRSLMAAQASDRRAAALKKDPQMTKVETIVAHLEWSVLAGRYRDIGEAALGELTDAARIRLFAAHYASHPNIELNSEGARGANHHLEDLAYWADRGGPDLPSVPTPLISVWMTAAEVEGKRAK
jgi:hypothetical protein